MLPPIITAALRRRKLPQISQIPLKYHPNRIKSPCLLCTRHFSAANNNNDAPPSHQSTPLQTSLALSVHFLHPKLGMKNYEILSRATAFLLNVDPLDDDSTTDALDTNSTSPSGRQTKSAFPHLAANREKRETLLRKQEYAYEPAGGPKRHAHDLNWLEFCPVNFRPRVHVVASSHVLSPWMWPQYYGQEWLKEVNEEHVRYSLEVYASKGGCAEGGQEGKLSGVFEPIAKFGLSPYPIHHPNGLDIAVIHLKGEDEALKHMKKMGVEPLNLETMPDFEKSTDPAFEPGERLLFHGFEVYEVNKADEETLTVDNETTKQSKDSKDDERIFHPYSASGTLTFGSPDRFLAKTPSPLPEGLCGGPVIPMQHNKKHPIYLRGVVEGIVPTNHENAQLAGSASFLPSYRIRDFIDFAERIMLQQIIEPEMFEKVVDIKEKRQQGKGTVYGEEEVRKGGPSDDDLPQDPNVLAAMEATSDGDTPQIDKAYQEIVSSLHKHHTPEEVDAILATVERERKEVLEILEKEGGDMDDVIADVRKRTYEERDRMLEEMRKSAEKSGDREVTEAEVVPKDKPT